MQARDYQKWQKKYSITELELCGLVINTASFSHLLKRVDFDAIVDHLSLTHIIKSKAEPATIRIKRLLEFISSYSFNLYYIKGKDMVLSDFLSRQNNDNSNPHEIIPISFNMHKALHENYYNIENYLVQTRSQARSSGIKLPEVHGLRKNLDPNIKPEKQHANPIKGDVVKPHIGQGRAGLKRKRADPINQTINPPSELSQKIPRETKIETGKTSQIHSKDPTQSVNNADEGMTHTRPLISDVPFHPGPTYRPPPKPIRSNMPRSQESSQSSPSIENINPDINLDFEENSPFQEDIISEAYQRPDKSFFQEPKEFNDLVNTSNLIQKFLPKQKYIVKIFKVIQRKGLKGTHLPVEIKEIQARYLNSSHFKDIYLYLSQNKLPTSKAAIRKVEMLAERYILLDSLLFKIVPEKETAVLAVPQMCTDKIIALYHSSLFAGYQCVIKIYLTISDKCFIQNLIHYFRSYIKGCHICQFAQNEKPPVRKLQTRINPNYVPLSRLSIDLKVMPRLHKGHKFILCIIDEVTNYLMTVPIHQAKSEEVGEALTENIITKYCILEYIIMDQNSAFMSSLMTYLLNKFNIKIRTVAHYNHHSLQAEHGIKSLSTIVTKHLINLGQMWPKYLPLATFAYNMLNTSNLGNYSPYELIFGRKLRPLQSFDSNSDIKVSGTFIEYYELLNKRLKYLHDVLLNFKSKRLAMINKDRAFFQYKGGDLVYIISPLTSQLCTASCKVTIKYVDPVVIYKIIDPHKYLLMTLDGKTLRGLFEHVRLKPTIIRTSQ